MSRLLIRKKIEGYMPANDHNIFPLSVKSKSKFLEPKDYIEIAIRYYLLDDCELMRFIIFLFFEDEEVIDWISIFPLYLYKTMIYYEKLSLFESLYEKEKEFDNFKGFNIIKDCFSYAIIINNITVALYLFKKYSKLLYSSNETIIDSILNMMNEYTENNGAVRYHHGISHFEELLYFLELFIDGFTYSQVNFFIRILYRLVERK